jgi:heme exporter protein CcmB
MSIGSTLRAAVRLAQKDLIVELRRFHEFISIIAFALTSVMISSFSWRFIISIDPVVMSSVLWTIVYFTSILVMTTSFSREVDRGTIDGLRCLPCPSYVILIGKIIYGCIILLIVLFSMISSSIIFLNLNQSVLGNLIFVFVIGVFDLALMGSILSALLMYSEGKNLLLSFLFFPVSIPILLPGIQACTKVISGNALLDVVPEIRLLMAFMTAIIAVSLIFFKDVFIE